MLSKLRRILARDTPQSKQWRLQRHESSQNSSAPEVDKSITKGRKQVEIYPFYEYRALNNKIWFSIIRRWVNRDRSRTMHILHNLVTLRKCQRLTGFSFARCKPQVEKKTLVRWLGLMLFIQLHCKTVYVLRNSLQVQMQWYVYTVLYRAFVTVSHKLLRDLANILCGLKKNKIQKKLKKKKGF